MALSRPELHARVQEVLATEVRPALQMEGVELELLGIEDGVARIRLQGSCSGCPGTVLALILEIEQELRKRVPEVEYLEAAP